MHSIYYLGKCEQFWGRALPIVLALDVAGKEYKLFHEEEAPRQGVFAFPIVTFPNGVTISQTVAILDVIGEECGLGGKTQAEKMKCKQILHDLTDVFDELIAGKLSSRDRAEKWFAVLDYHLSDGFFVGSDLTVADLYAFSVFEWLVKKGVEFEDFPNMKKWSIDIKQVPAVKAKIESDVPIVPAFV